MVPQKNNDVVHDFENDPIQTWIDGEWVKAKGTTLGADDGLGVAMANAKPEVIAAADYVTLSNEEDGVAAVVEKFCAQI